MRMSGKRYKLLYFYEADAWKLYNISDDIGEDSNLIAEQTQDWPAQLSKKINAWLSQQHPTWKPKYPIVKTKQASPPARRLSCN